MDNTNQLLGYFDDPSQEEPKYDPGINVPCLICFKPLDYPNKKIKTISVLAYFDHADRSYFYRCHKECYELLSEEEKGEIDTSIMGESFGTVQDLNRLNEEGYTIEIFKEQDRT